MLEGKDVQFGTANKGIVSEEQTLADPINLRGVTLSVQRYGGARRSVS